MRTRLLNAGKRERRIHERHSKVSATVVSNAGRRTLAAPARRPPQSPYRSMPITITIGLEGNRAYATLPDSLSRINLVDPASSHTLVSKIKPCMSKYKQFCTVKLRMAHYISHSLLDTICYLDNRSNSRANTCTYTPNCLRTGGAY